MRIFACADGFTITVGGLLHGFLRIDNLKLNKMDIIKYMKHLDSCLMERIDDFENLGQSPKCDCGLNEAIQQVKNLQQPAVMPSVCIPHCPNKETDADKCEWRGHTCFLCDMQTEA